MKILATTLPGVLLLEPSVFRDERGFFLETYNAERFAAHAGVGLPASIRQTNHSRSRRDVLRGLHYQLEHPQGKLVSVARGAIYDVAVDVRPDSPTFRQWFGVELSDEEPRALWIPAGYAHGFCVLTDVADVTYACTDVYVAADDRGVRWDDADLAIDWPTDAPVVSVRDASLPSLADAELPRLAGVAP